jgi:hypothetical protein
VNGREKTRKKDHIRGKIAMNDALLDKRLHSRCNLGCESQLLRNIDLLGAACGRSYLCNVIQQSVEKFKAYRA